MENPRKQIFNNLASSWDEINILTKAQHSTIKKIIDMSDISGGDTILDIGCGTGILVKYLLDKLNDKGRIFGIDVADRMIEKAIKKYNDKRITFVAGDLYTHLFNTNFFNKIFIFSTFPHFHDKQEAFSIFYEILKAGGRLIIFHVENSESINAFHKNKTSNDILKSDYLPCPEEIMKLIDKQKWLVLSCTDEKGLYLVNLEKK